MPSRARRRASFATLSRGFFRRAISLASISEKPVEEKKLARGKTPQHAAQAVSQQQSPPLNQEFMV